MKRMKMIKFRELFSEDKKIDHSHGTYVNVKPSEADKNKLYDWVVENGISKPMDKDDYHTTVIYSKTPCPDVDEYDFDLPITGSICGWKIFESTLGRCLVAQVQSEELQVINADLKRDYGATSDFPEYIPHITISWGYEGSIPDNYPAMKITYDKVEVKGLDPNWTPKK
jgi:hypothetical protein